MPWGSRCASLQLPVLPQPLLEMFFRPNLSNLLCFLHRTVIVRYMSVLNKHSCKHLGKWKFALGEHIRNSLAFLVPQNSYLTGPPSWEMPIFVIAGTTSHKQIRSYYKNKVPGPNSKKLAVSDFTPVTPTLPGGPPRCPAWSKKTDATSQPFENQLFLINAVIIKKPYFITSFPQKN